MEKKLKEILGIEDYLCFHSVLDGFRAIGMISLGHNSDSKKEIIKNLRYIKEYLIKKYPNYIVQYGRGDFIYFIGLKEKHDTIKQFLSKYPNPLYSTEGEAQLGILLNYPKCCVTSHIKGKNKNIRKSLSVIPFRQCSIGHDTEWEKEFKKLIKKFNIDDGEIANDIIFDEL